VSEEVTVFKVWWSTSLLPDPVAPGKEGQTERTVANRNFAYAILAPGWDPSSSSPPARFLPLKSGGPLNVGRGDTLHVHVSDSTFVGDCAANKTLSQDDADFITQRIFPAEFTGKTYDAKSCTISSSAADAGAADPSSGADALPADAGPK
jgi:hypothetical protein